MSWEFLGQHGDQPVNPKGNQPWIFIGRTDIEADAPVFCSPDANGDSQEKTLMLGKIEGRRRRGCQRMGWLNDITKAMDMNLGTLWGTGRPGMLQSMGLQKVGHDWATEEQQVKSLSQWAMFLKDRNPEENKPLQLIQSSDLVDSFFLLELPVVVANECRGEYVSSSSPGVPRCWNQERGADYRLPTLGSLESPLFYRASYLRALFHLDLTELLWS